MPLFIFAMLLKAVVECARAFVRKPREAKPAPLCADCVFAHVQYGAKRGVRSPVLTAVEYVR
jgi:hypothetical protein